MSTDRDLSSAWTGELESCDAYVVLVADPQTGAADTYGPFGLTSARTEVDRRLRELRSEGLDDVAVDVVRHHHRGVADGRG